MLEEMGRDAEPDSCCATGDNVHLVGQSALLRIHALKVILGLFAYFAAEVWNVFVGIELVSGD